MSLIDNDAYGRTVDFDTDGTTDTYLVGGTFTYTFATGTPTAAAYLSFTRQTNIARAQPMIQQFVADHYSLETRFAFNALLLCAQNTLVPKVNRIAYIMQLMTWAQAVVAYAATYVGTVMAMTDQAAIAAKLPDFTQVPADPYVTTVAAVQINN